MPEAVLRREYWWRYLAGEVDSIGSSSSSGVLAELRQAVQLAVEQQQQLEELRDIVKQQNMFISRLCRRDVTLGLELRQTTVQNKDACTDVSYVTSAQPAAAGNVCFLFMCISLFWWSLDREFMYCEMSRGFW